MKHLLLSKSDSGRRENGSKVRNAPIPVVLRTATFDSKRTSRSKKDHAGGETLVFSRLEPERVSCYGYVSTADTILSPRGSHGHRSNTQR